MWNRRDPFPIAGFITVFLTALLVAGCATPTPYSPAVDGKGYAEQQLEGDRFRVSFAGNSVTPRETVENYLLYRAAEITLKTGNDHFRIVEQETETETVYRTTSSGFGGHGFGSFPYHFRSSFAGFSTGTARPITSYEAFANVLVFSGKTEKESDQTYDARDVIQKLGPVIVRPQTKSS